MLLLQQVKCSIQKSLSKKVWSIKNESAHLVEELTESDVKDIVETENALISSGEIVLMQTAQVTMENPVDRKQESGRIIFNSGSQRTYITESLARKLNLKLGEMNEKASKNTINCFRYKT